MIEGIWAGVSQVVFYGFLLVFMVLIPFSVFGPYLEKKYMPIANSEIEKVGYANNATFYRIKLQTLRQCKPFMDSITWYGIGKSGQVHSLASKLEGDIWVVYKNQAPETITEVFFEQGFSCHPLWTSKYIHRSLG